MMSNLSHYGPQVSASCCFRFGVLSRVLRSHSDPSGVPVRLRPKVLIVEDNLLLAINTEDYLTAAGFEVVGIAVSAVEAVALAERHKPDLAVMDIRLPGGADGIDTAVILREKYGIPSVFASAHSAPEMKDRASLAMPAGWLTKPYAMGDLVAVLSSALKPRDPLQ
jgi:DNA-binding response OmpR family regulator